MYINGDGFNARPLVQWPTKPLVLGGPEVDKRNECLMNWYKICYKSPKRTNIERLLQSLDRVTLLIA